MFAVPPEIGTGMLHGITMRIVWTDYLGFKHSNDRIAFGDAGPHKLFHLLRGVVILNGWWTSDSHHLKALKIASLDVFKSAFESVP